MNRLYLNPTLRYQSVQTGIEEVSEKRAKKNKVAYLNEAHSLELSQRYSDSADNLNWLIYATMPNDINNSTLIGDPAYLIYRELNSSGNKIEFEPLKNEEIVRLESNGSYCYVYLADNKRYLLAMSLKWVFRYLGDFIRIHRTHAVNPLFVQQYLVGAQKKQKDRYLLLKTNEMLPWSRRHLRERRQDSPHLFNVTI